MKYLIVLALNLYFFSSTFSQTSNGILKLDGLALITRNVQDENDISPLAPTDPNYKEPKVEVTIQFTIANIQLLKSIEITFEKEKGKKDFKIFKLDYVVANGRSYLTIKNKSYEVIDSRVSITEEVPAQFLKRKIFFSIGGTDVNQNKSNILTREFN